ncbi:MAG: RCC1 domain-containing protein [Isosphaeraceae bacterium]
MSGTPQAYGATVVGWGQDNDGQIGTTPAETCETFYSCRKVSTPVSGLAGVTEIAAAETHILALLSNGTVVAWGYNGNGELGDGTTTESSTPVQVKGISNAIQVAASVQHSLALLADGTVVAWGENGYGELGAGTTEGPEECPSPCSMAPRPVPGLTDVVAISAGEEYNLALRANGTVVAWGYDQYGTIGDGNHSEKTSLCLCVTSPTPVPGVSGALAISAGMKLGMALLADGRVIDWGANYDGELGNGTDNTNLSEAQCYCQGPVVVTGLSGVKAIAAGGYHGLALLPDGTLKAWGFNADGELATGSFTGPEDCGGDPCSKVPLTVNGLSGPGAISAGTFHTLALLPDGTVDSWGFNARGQLGNGTTESSNLPVGVGAISGASGVSAHEPESFALLGPSQTLSVGLAGAGAGVVGGSGGILCPSACSSRFTQDAVESLRAEPAAGSGFAGFSGACTGTGLCRVTMGQGQSVEATFGPPKGTTITKAKISSRKKSARFRFAAPGAITGFECELIRPKPHHHHRKHKSARRVERAKPHFAACGPGQKDYKHLRPGRYTFKVRALDILGADAVPATKRFKIKLVKNRKHKSKH